MWVTFRTELLGDSRTIKTRRQLLHIPIPILTNIMQFKLVALLTLAIASVNGAALDKRGGESCVHPLYWPMWL